MAATLNDGVLSKLAAYPGTANDKQKAWLNAIVIGSNDSHTLDGLWGMLCTQSGFTDGTTQDRVREYMRQVIGASPTATYNDIQRAFWNT